MTTALTTNVTGDCASTFRTQAVIQIENEVSRNE
jgi:hypothetical protein